MKCTPRLLGLVASAVVLLALLTLVAGPQPALAQSIQVLSANPNTAEQGTVNLNVVIKGKGFKRGAKAKFYKHDPNQAGSDIQVNSTTFNSSTEVVANIDVPVDAAVEMYDIEVMNSDGRGGKGTELFSVTNKGAACVIPDPVLAVPSCASKDPGTPGCLDSNFGNGAGRVMAVRGMQINGIALQYVEGEARIVAVGQAFADSCVSGGGQVWTVVRFHADGTLDETFGNGGVVKTTSFTGKGSAYADAIAVLPDNNLLVAGNAPVQKLSQNVPTLIRYLPDGALDTSFGGTGIVNLLMGRTGGWISDVVLQADGKIVAVGGYGTWNPYKFLSVSRLNSNGSLDKTFNGTGQFLYNSYTSGADAVALQRVGTEDRIVVAGHMVKTYAYDTAMLVRFTASGALDTTFGDNGLVEAAHPPLDGGAYNGGFFHDLAIDTSDNSIVAAGELNGAIQIARYDVSGSLYSDFGEGGFVLPPMLPGQTAAVPYSVVLQPDRSILAAGWVFFGDSPWGMGAWRFTPQGLPDMLFGDGGFVFESFPNEGTPYPHALANDLVLQSDGRFICAGNARQMVGTTYFRYAALARFWH